MPQSSPEAGRIPELVGLTVAEARAVLARAGLPLSPLVGFPEQALIIGQSESADGQPVLTVTETRRPVDAAPTAEPTAQPRPLDPETLPEEAEAPIDDLLEECDRLNREFEPATLHVEDPIAMQVDDARPVSAAVTLDVDQPSRWIIGLDEATAIDIRVTCRVRAQLTGAPADFDIDNRDWLEESLVTSRTAQWSWFVTAKRAGEKELVLAVRPVVIVDRSATGGDVSEIEASTLRHRISVQVSAPPYQFLVTFLDRAAGLLQSVNGLLIAATAVILASLGFWAAVRRKGGAANSPGDGAGDESGQAGPSA